jgi:N-acetylmuramoyl-L-alanine amidase
MKVLRHRLHDDDGNPCSFEPSPNQGSGTITPEYLVMHYTAGGSAASSISWLTNPQARASAHLVIGRRGELTQLVAFNRRAWHAGASSWNGRSGLNGFSIGIELANAGKLKRSSGGWITDWGAAIDPDRVLEAEHPHGGPVTGWETFPEPQLMRALHVAALLARHYDLKDVLGHQDVSPGRKSDPGPAFPMAGFRGAVLGRAMDDADDDVHQTTTAVNIRQGPGTDEAKLTVSPLPAGTRVSVVDTRGVWRLVDVLDNIDGDHDVHGWVHGRYIRPV